MYGETYITLCMERDHETPSSSARKSLGSAYSARMKIAVFVAGTNEPSNSDILAEAFIEGMRSENPDIVKLRLKDLQLSHFDLHHYDPNTAKEDDFCRVMQAFDGSDGVVFVTPIWNFSVPAHFKNFIDRIGAFALDQQTHSKGQFQGKPFFILFTGGAPMIAWQALMYLTTLHVQEAVKYYGGVVIGKHFEPRCLPGRGKFGLVVDKREGSLEKMRRRGKRFAEVCAHYRANGHLPFFVRLRYSLFTFLYRVGNRIMYPLSNLQ